MPKRKLVGTKEHSGEGGGAKKQLPGGADDGSKWSKSKKKRMRAKLAKQNARQQGGSGDGGPGQRQGKQGKQQQKKEKSEGNNDQTRKKKRQKKHEQSSQDNDAANQASNTCTQQSRELNTSVRAKSALQQSFLARLSGSRFRELNEDLYTTTSDTAFKRFSENPELFDQYHEGFRKQVSQWPVNPVDVIIRWIRKKGAQKQGSKKKGSLVIADFGCGDAKLGKELGGQGNQKTKKQKKENGDNNGGFKVHSFDLVANGNPLITPCDMANVPLDDGVVDIAVFCLALMGTNIADFIREAHRVLKSDGVIKIAEVRSRFEATADGDDGHGGGGGGGKKRADDSLLNEFIDTMDELGFECTQKDRSNRMFILMEFAKNGEMPSTEATFTAKPCIYKRR